MTISKSESSKAHYQRNRDKVLKRTKAYYVAHKEQQLAKQKAWRLANKDKIIARSRKYYLRHVKQENIVVMVPTALPPYEMPYGETIPRGAIIVTFDNSTYYNKGMCSAKDRTISNYTKEMFFHLYFLSKDDIKKGEWAYDPIANIVTQVQLNLKSGDFGAMKVIATTDEKLGLPIISEDEVENYILKHKQK